MARRNGANMVPPSAQQVHDLTNELHQARAELQEARRTADEIGSNGTLTKVAAGLQMQLDRLTRLAPLIDHVESHANAFDEQASILRDGIANARTLARAMPSVKELTDRVDELGQLKAAQSFITEQIITPPTYQTFASDEVTIPTGAGSISVDSTTGQLTVNGNLENEFWVPPATGNGTTDTTNISNVFNALNSAGGGVIRFPACSLAQPLYNITSALPVITSGVHMYGSGDWFVNPGGNVTQLQFAAGLPGFQININNTGNASGSVIEHIGLISQDNASGANYGTPNTDHGIDISNGQNHGIRLSKIQLFGFGGHGLNMNGSVNQIACVFEQMRIVRCVGNGFDLEGNNASTTLIMACDLDDIGGWAWNLNSPGTTLINCQTAAAGLNPGRTITDAVLNGTQTMTSATANFTSADIGVVVTDTGGAGQIPTNTSIVTVVNSTTVTLNQVVGTSAADTVNIQAGGALLDHTLGNGYINFYAEGGQGSNCAFLSGAAQNWWIGGGWSSAWFSTVNQGTGAAGGSPVLMYAGAGQGVRGNFNFPSTLKQQLAVQSATGNGKVQLTPATNPSITLTSDTGGVNPVINFISANGTATLQGVNVSGSDVAPGLQIASTLIVNGGPLHVATAGQGVKVKEGTNAKQGITGAMTAGSVTVANTSVTATSRILVCRGAGGTNPGAWYVSAQTAGTGFTVTSTNAADTGNGVFFILEPG